MPETDIPDPNNGPGWRQIAAAQGFTHTAALTDEQVADLDAHYTEEAINAQITERLTWGEDPATVGPDYGLSAEQAEQVAAGYGTDDGDGDDDDDNFWN